MIVIEGMDNSGKSTLGVALGQAMNRRVQESEGPPLSAEEINARIDRYEDLSASTIFVRHPVISNAIYGAVREEGDPITADRRVRFYDNKPLIIYCDAGIRGLGAHVLKAHDTQKHIEDITNNYNKLLYLYRQWAAEYATFIYRIGDDMDEMVDLVDYLSINRHI